MPCFPEPESSGNLTLVLPVSVRAAIAAVLLIGFGPASPSLSPEKSPERGAQCAGLAAVPLPGAARRGRAGSSPGSRGPEPGAHGAPAWQGCGAAPRLPGQQPALCPLPSGALGQRLLAAPQGCAGTGGRDWVQAAPGPGAEPAPTLPSCRSLQLAEDRSRAAEHLRRALPYLRSPQESLRAAAIRFMGMAGRHLRGKKEELQLICTALEPLTEDISSAVSDVALETLYVLRALQSERYSLFQRLQDQLRRAWRTRPRLAGLGWLRCCSSAET
ncbi:uncharacterized protein LOC135441674 [Zonotrichia leucophrys gambelii]|uniref:uncharacterized protein LOC135441674 n=1 Tax=Zonotrichia leucophrys gambelii TaxID=257770 RepID=UPI0031405875